ncbi:MAG TPA: hypothetical protein VF018_17050 [Acidobacteriaceae bacterium]
MADPLHRDEVRDFEVSDVATPVSPGERSGGNRVPLHDPVLQGLNNPLSGTMNPERQLEADFHGNRRLNRTAESIGGGLGRAVSRARRMPESARRGLHVVRDRASAASGEAAESLSASASSLADSARHKAEELRVTAEQHGHELREKARELRNKAGELGESISTRASELGDNVQRQAGELKRQVEVRSRELRAQARLKTQEARLRGKLLVHERPLETLGGIAAGAFITGVVLRIVRSRNGRGY